MVGAFLKANLAERRTYGLFGVWVLIVTVVSAGRGSAGACALYTLQRSRVP